VIAVVEPGWASTIQDLGRPGFAHLGVSPAGMVDPGLGTLVNRLVGNPSGAALIETCGGLVLRAERPVLVASTAESGPRIVAAGETYRVAGVDERLWHYVAVRGGVTAAVALGSASADTLSGIGPAPLRAGDRLLAGPDPGTELTTDLAPLAPLGDRARVSAGPRADWVEVDWAAPLTVADVSRVGVRLAGARIGSRRAVELPSEGLVRGAIQAPPGGELVMMLADHPTTGGYPVIAVVHPDDVAVVAQHRPGTTLRLHLT